MNGSNVSKCEQAGAHHSRKDVIGGMVYPLSMLNARPAMLMTPKQTDKDATRGIKKLIPIHSREPHNV